MEEPTLPGETVEHEECEGFPSTSLLMTLYRLGTIFSLVLGFSLDPESAQSKSCFLTAFILALGGLWIYSISVIDSEDGTESSE